MSVTGDSNDEPARAPAEELAALRDELLVAKRQALVGQVAAAVAHDFNNALTAVLGYAEMLLGDAEPGHPWRADLEEIHKSGQRAAHLARRLLAFNRQADPLPQPLSLARLLDELEPVLRPLLGEGVQWSVTYDPEAAGVEVLVDKGLACELIFTLGWLARSCAAPGGSCRVWLSGARPGPGLTLNAATTPEPRAAPEPSLRQVVRCTVDSVTDSGFSAEASATLESGVRHLGALVGRAGGTLDTTGTPASWQADMVFAVESAPAVEPAPPTAGARPPGLTVLLVEDEDLLRDVVGRMLERSGITVLEAGTGEEALEVLERGTPQPDLLITDIVMPGVSGTDLAARVQERQPSVRVLFISGYLDAPATGLSRAGERSLFLPKPFTRDQLLDAIDRLMGGEEDRSDARRPEWS
jgi:CheY-like chemotaxis protein